MIVVSGIVVIYIVKNVFNTVKHLLKEKDTVMDEMYNKFDSIDEQLEEISNKRWRK